LFLAKAISWFYSPSTEVNVVWEMILLREKTALPDGWAKPPMGMCFNLFLNPHLIFTTAHKNKGKPVYSWL